MAEWVARTLLIKHPEHRKQVSRPRHAFYLVFVILGLIVRSDIVKLIFFSFLDFQQRRRSIFDTVICPDQYCNITRDAICKTRPVRSSL